METVTGSAPIRIALLGVDDATLAIARAIVDGSRFELVGVCELDGERGRERPRLSSPNWRACGSSNRGKRCSTAGRSTR